jgi:hypothetical protein
MPTRATRGARFVEALDTVRSRRPDPGRWEFHARAELTLAVLYGETVVVSEPQAFDSTHFVRVANAMLAAREALAPEARGRAPLPFTLALRGTHPSYRHMVADLLGACGPGPTPPFTLSSTPKLNDAVTTRRELARAIRRYDEDAWAAACHDVDTAEVGHVDGLLQLARYFGRTKVVCRRADGSGVALEACMRELRDRGAAERGDDERSEQIRTMAATVDDLTKLTGTDQVNLNNRSSIYRGLDRLARPEAEKRTVREYTDSAYNELICDVTRATTASMSAVTNASDAADSGDQGVAQELAAAVYRGLRREQRGTPVTSRDLRRALRFELASGDAAELELGSVPYASLWEVATSEECQRSIDAVYAKTQESTGAGLVEAEKHLQWIAHHVTALELTHVDGATALLFRLMSHPKVRTVAGVVADILAAVLAASAIDAGAYLGGGAVGDAAGEVVELAAGVGLRRLLGPPVEATVWAAPAFRAEQFFARTRGAISIAPARA